MKLVRIFAPMMKHWLTMIFVIAMCTSSHSQTPSDGEKKTKFFGKINHWFTAYGMSSPDFLTAERIAFKQKAFAEVYVEAGINYDAWMFNLLDKVTKFRYPAKQEPHVIFQVKFTPKDSTLTNYSVQLGINVVAPVSLNLDDIAKEMESSLSGKWYENPEIAMPDVTRVLALALTKVAEKVGDRLAPNLMVRYGGEVFWKGHEIPIFQEEGNYVELEAIDKNLEPIDPSLLKWTNADPSVSRGIVDMTGVTSKEVTLVKTDDEKNPLKVTIVKAEAQEDINELLKQLIIEVLSAKKKEAQDTIIVLRQDSTRNLEALHKQLAQLESDNLELEGEDSFRSQYPEPLYFPDSIKYFHNDPDKSEGFRLLKTHKRLQSKIRRKVNVVAFADLVVDKPEMIKTLLDELLKNSGRLVARILLNKDSEGQKADARNIVIDFLNKNLERIAGGHYPSSLSTIQPLPPVIITKQLPRYDKDKLYHISSKIQFPEKESFEQSLKTYLSNLHEPAFVTINYSQDASSETYVKRVKGTRPSGLPNNRKYVTFTIVHIPGSVKYQIFSGGIHATSFSDENKIGDELLNILKSELPDDLFIQDYWSTVAQSIYEQTHREVFGMLYCRKCTGANQKNGEQINDDQHKISIPGKKCLLSAFRQTESGDFITRSVDGTYQLASSPGSGSVEMLIYDAMKDNEYGFVGLMSRTPDDFKSIKTIQCLESLDKSVQDYNFCNDGFLYENEFMTKLIQSLKRCIDEQMEPANNASNDLTDATDIVGDDIVTSVNNLLGKTLGDERFRVVFIANNKKQEFGAKENPNMTINYKKGDDGKWHITAAYSEEYIKKLASSGYFKKYGDTPKILEDFVKAMDELMRKAELRFCEGDALNVNCVSEPITFLQVLTLNLESVATTGAIHEAMWYDSDSKRSLMPKGAQWPPAAGGVVDEIVEEATAIPMLLKTIWEVYGDEEKQEAMKKLFTANGLKDALVSSLVDLVNSDGHQLEYKGARFTVMIAFMYYAIVENAAKSLDDALQQAAELTRKVDNAPAIRNYMAEVAKLGTSGSAKTKQIQKLIDEIGINSVETIFRKVELENITALLDDIAVNSKLKEAFQAFPESAAVWRKSKDLKVADNLRRNPEFLKKASTIACGL